MTPVFSSSFFSKSTATSVVSVRHSGVVITEIGDICLFDGGDKAAHLLDFGLNVVHVDTPFQFDYVMGIAPRMKVSRSENCPPQSIKKKAHRDLPCTLLLPLRGAILTFAPEFPAETQKAPDKRNLRHFDNSDYCV